MPGSGRSFERAHGGTLYLDEVADMPRETQSRILRVLVEQRFRRVGGDADVQVDVRVVSSTSRDLREEITAGRFREDLYYRVNSLTVSLPPLRERSDIRCIVERILEREARDAGLSGLRIGEEVMRFIERYIWPGNVRQLHNVIRVAVALLDEGELEILPAHLPEELFT